MNIEIGNKPIDFVFQGDELIYPNYAAKENLVLHYDFSGRTNLDIKKGIAEDLSGNGNNGVLNNFAFESGSGYDSNSYLEFDNVDDFITIPELNLDVNDFTVAVDGEVLSYRGDNVAKINENGLEIGGRNYIFKPSLWQTLGGFSVNGYTIIDSDGNYYRTARSNTFNLYAGQSYTLSFDVLQVEGNFDAQVIMPPSTAIFRKVNVILGRNVYTFTPSQNYVGAELRFFGTTQTTSLLLEVANIKLEHGNKATDWTPAPEDLQTTPIFSNKIKTLMYWNRALTDTELQEVYNVQKHRI